LTGGAGHANEPFCSSQTVTGSMSIMGMPVNQTKQFTSREVQGVKDAITKQAALSGMCCRIALP